VVATLTVSGSAGVSTPAPAATNVLAPVTNIVTALTGGSGSAGNGNILAPVTNTVGGLLNGLNKK
jgi:hypothetical protein